AVVIHTPITELKRSTRRLEHLALHDPLTGLPNRVLLERRLAEALEPGAGTASALLVCDLDDFKRVNDGLGHAVGDAALVEVGRRLGNAVRSVDTVARLSGDEFVVLVPGLGRADVERLGGRILDAFDEPMRLDDGQEVRLGLSVGLVLAEPGADPGELLRDADAAMYWAKEHGRGQLRWFDDRLRSEVLERLELKRDLNRGLELGEMVCCHQPLIDLGDGTLAAVESLVRWHHPTRGLLDPARFVPGVETAGAAARLFDHVLAASLAAQQRWAAVLGWTPAVTVNLSPGLVREANLADVVAYRLNQAGAAPSSLWLEVPEPALAEPPDPAALVAVAGLGVRLVVDEVGAGASSLGRLAELPAELLKLDRGVVARLGAEPAAARLVEAVLAMAHTLGLGVAAVGVETAAQRDALAAMGCDLGQGYLLGSPEPPARLAEGIGARRRWVGRPGAGPATGECQA
ncbi:MAG: putative bifunctional diguanylate cyclase/phosphodiesterase, partial [Actinomycetota bacterium]